MHITASSQSVPPTMHGLPEIRHARVDESQASCGQSEFCKHEQKAWMPVSPVPRHCGTHLCELGSQTAPMSSALSQSSLTMPPTSPGWFFDGSHETCEGTLAHAERPALGSQFCARTMRT